MKLSLPSPVRSLWNRLVATPAQGLANYTRTTVAALTFSIHIKTANVWRDLFNPLRGLTMQRAVSHLEEGERGAYADLQWLYRFIEKRDATLRGGKRSLLGAVCEMDWEIKPVADDKLPVGYTPAQAEAQKRTLRAAYDRILNLNDAIEFLGLAEFRGFSHLEKIRDASGQIIELLKVEQWYWCREGLNGLWTYNRRAASGLTRGEPVDLSRFIIREIDDPINEIALLAFVRKSLGRKDEDGFMESYGIPSIFAIMPQNVPEDEAGKYQDLAEQVISDSRGALPYGSEIKTVDAGARGVAPFKDYQERLDKEIVMAITSGALTMLAESGSGTLAGGAHSETFMRVARALAKKITTCFQQQLDMEILAAAHPGQPPLAYFEILANEETNVSELVNDITSLKQAGYVVPASYIEEKTAYPIVLSDAGTPARKGLSPLALPNRVPGPRLPFKYFHEWKKEVPHDLTDEFLTSALATLGQGMQADFKPVAERLQELMAEDLSDEDLRAGLELLLEDLPRLAEGVADSEATVAAWESILGTALGNEISTEV